MTTYKYFYDVIKTASEEFPDKVSFRKRSSDNKFNGRTFLEIRNLVDQIAAGLIKEGLKVGDRVAFLCDSSPNWFICDCGLVTAGGVSVPRGTDVTDEDIIYILSHSESKFAIVQKEKDKKRLQNLHSHFKKLETIYIIEEADGSLHKGKDGIHTLCDIGKKALSQNPGLIQERLNKTNPEELATLIYTSGTTGSPKGVMLSQKNWINAVNRSLTRVTITKDDKIVSLLPPWHAFERGIEYGVVIRGADLLISDSTKIKEDLRDFQPTIFPSVPRIWESVYNGIMAKIKKEPAKKQKIFNFFLDVGTLWAKEKSVLLGYDPQMTKPFFLFSWLRKLRAFLILIAISPAKLMAIKVFAPIHAAVGGKLKLSFSGGSALPGVVDKFLTSIGILVLEGYGLTETSASIAVRRENKPTPGTLGNPYEGYQIKIKDEKGNDVSKQPGMRGTLWVKSDQILMGYYKRPELDKVVFDSEGFFDTGDIMTLNWRGDLQFAGRAKDTIALSGGENVEPGPIEDRLLVSDYVDQVMVVGDDKKTLGVIIVPNFEQVKSDLKELPSDPKKWNENKQVRELFKREILRLISKESGFKVFEMIPGNCFYIAPRNFDPDTEMTRTLKMKRPVIKHNFKKEIDSMYS